MDAKSLGMATMSNSIAFALLVVTVLVTPGPTNTLLATAGATVGWRRALILIPAELIGYAVSIMLLALLLRPLTETSASISIGLRLGCAAYLVLAAWRLWRSGMPSLVKAPRPARFQDVLVTTLLNPKGLLFALGIFPGSATETPASFFPYLAAFSVICTGVAFSWIVFGAMLGRAASGHVATRRFSQVGAVVLACFALSLVTSTMR
jgi:threonine/homoserine/homoserine lactone efflux protein